MKYGLCGLSASAQETVLRTSLMRSASTRLWLDAHAFVGLNGYFCHGEPLAFGPFLFWSTALCGSLETIDWRGNVP